MSTITAPPPPSLDPCKPHSPSEVAKWKQDLFDYHLALKEADKVAKAALEAANAPEPLLTAEDVYQRQLERYNAQQAKQLEQALEALADKKAKELFLASRPETVEIHATNDTAFLSELQHWIQAGYTVHLEGHRIFQLGFYSCILNAPVAKAGKK